MKNLLFFIYAYTLTIPTIFYCTCPPPTKNFSELQKERYEHAEAIFTGRAHWVSPTQEEYEVIVTEGFKGVYDAGDILCGANANDCSDFITEKGEWLMYGKFYEGKFEILGCGISRPLSRPWDFWHGFLPPFQNEKEIKAHKKKWEEILEKEICKLRNSRNLMLYKSK